MQDRYNILSIHTRAWSPQLKLEFLSELADSSVGYCGADLRALCTEAALFALRRKYPQIYKTTDKLVLDVASINVAASDFHNALKVIVPTAQRSDASSACAIPEHVRPLLLKTFDSLLSLVSFVFPPSWKAINRAAKDVKILTKLEGDQLKRMIASLQNMEINHAGNYSNYHPEPCHLSELGFCTVDLLPLINAWCIRTRVIVVCLFVCYRSSASLQCVCDKLNLPAKVSAELQRISTCGFR